MDNLKNNMADIYKKFWEFIYQESGSNNDSKGEQIDINATIESFHNIFNENHFNEIHSKLLPDEVKPKFEKSIIENYVTGKSGRSKNFKITYFYRNKLNLVSEVNTIFKLYYAPWEKTNKPSKHELPGDAYEVAIYKMMELNNLSQYFPKLIHHFPNHHGFEIEYIKNISLREYLELEMMPIIVLHFQITLLAKVYNYYVDRFHEHYTGDKLNKLELIKKSLLELESSAESVRKKVSDKVFNTVLTIGNKSIEINAIINKNNPEYLLPEIEYYDLRNELKRENSQISISSRNYLGYSLKKSIPDCSDELLESLSPIVDMLAEANNKYSTFSHGDLNLDNILVGETYNSLSIKFIDLFQCKVQSMQLDDSDFLERIDPDLNIPVKTFFEFSIQPFYNFIRLENMIELHDDEVVFNWNLIISILDDLIMILKSPRIDRGRDNIDTNINYYQELAKNMLLAFINSVDPKHVKNY